MVTIGDKEPTQAPTVGSGYLNQYAKSLRKTGIDFDAMLMKAGISTQQMETLNARVPGENAARLLKYCSLVLNDEAHGNLGNPSPIGHFRLIALSVVHRRTLGQALQRFVEHMNIGCNSIQLALHIEGLRARIELSPIPDHRPVSHWMLDLQLMMIHCFLGWLGGLPGFLPGLRQLRPRPVRPHLPRQVTFVVDSNNYAWARSMKRPLRETCFRVSQREQKS